MAQRLLLQAQTALRLLRRSGLGVRRRLAAVRRPAAGAGPRRRARVGPPAGLRQRAVHVGALAAARRGARRAARHRPRRARAWPGWSSTPTCGGASSPRWPPPGDIDADGQATPFIDAEVRARPDRGRQAQRAPRGGGRAAADRRSRSRRGSSVIEDDTLPNIAARAIIDGFVAAGSGRAARSRSRRATSTRSPASGSDGPARSRRRW